MTDLALRDGDLGAGDLVTDGEDIAQRVTIALQKFLGEWRLNTDAGCDWLREPRLTEVQAAGIALRAVSQVDGVVSAQVDSVRIDASRIATIRVSINGIRTTIDV